MEELRMPRKSASTPRKRVIASSEIRKGIGLGFR